MTCFDLHAPLGPIGDDNAVVITDVRAQGVNQRKQERLSSVQGSLQSRLCYLKTVEAAKAKDYQTFFTRGPEALIRIRSATPLRGCTFWSLHPDSLQRIDERLGIDLSKIAAFRVFTDDANCALSVDFEYDYGPMVIDLYFDAERGVL